MSEELKGRVFADRYEIGDQLGVGGFGEVWLGYDPAFERQVAVKILLPKYKWDPKLVDSFVNEARTIASLEHPHILRAYDLQTQRDGDESQVYLVLQFVKNGSLADRLKQSPPLTFEEIKRIFAQVCLGVDYAHRHKVLHLDLKPANILLDDDNNALIADFGISKVLETTTHVKASTRVGTLNYMAPEQLFGGDVGIESDVYALGIIFHEMLFGKRPQQDFDTSPVLIIEEFLDSRVKQIIEQATASQRKERFGSAKELADAVNRLSLPPFPMPIGCIMTGSVPTVGSMSYSPNGKYLAIGLFPGGERDDELMGEMNRVWLLDARNMTCLRKLDGVRNEDGLNRTSSLEFSPDNRFLVATHTNYGGRREFGQIHIWNVDNGQLLKKFDAQVVSPVTFSPDGRFLAWNDQDSLILWELSKDQVFKKLDLGNAGDVRDIVLGPGGNLMTITDTTLTIWETGTGRLILDVPANISSFNVNPDGTVLAVVTQWDEVMLFNLSGKSNRFLLNREIRRFKAEANNGVNKIAFSPDGRFLAIGGSFEGGNCGGIQLWDLDSGESWVWMKEEDMLPYGFFAFSPDSKFLTTSVGGEIWQFSVPQISDLSFEARGKAALTELFKEIRKGDSAGVWRLVNEIDQKVREARSQGWQATSFDNIMMRKALKEGLFRWGYNEDEKLVDQVYRIVKEYY